MRRDTPSPLPRIPTFRKKSKPGSRQRKAYNFSIGVHRKDKDECMNGAESKNCSTVSLVKPPLLRRDRSDGFCKLATHISVFRVSLACSIRWLFLLYYQHAGRGKPRRKLSTARKYMPA